MVDIKEIKSIKLTSFTKMSASIYAILGFVAAICMLVVLTIVQVAGVIPQLGNFNIVTGVGIPLIVLLPVGAFLITLTTSLLSAMFYNMLVPRLGGIKLELDGIDIVKIPVVSFALILSAIGAIWAFIIGLLAAAFITPIISLIGSSPEANNITANLTNATGTPVDSSVFGTAGILVPILLVIGLPILVFVFGFIWNALFALFYNYIVTRVAKIKLEFENITGSLYKLKHIPVIPTALAVALVYLLLGLLGIFSGNYAEFLTNFISYFIQTAIIALAYNYLAPKIGSIKLNLE